MEIEEDLTVLDEDISGLEIDLMELEGDVNFLFEGMILQDERLLTLEQENDVIYDELESEIFFILIIFTQSKLKICNVLAFGIVCVGLLATMIKRCTG